MLLWRQRNWNSIPNDETLIDAAALKVVRDSSPSSNKRVSRLFLVSQHPGCPDKTPSEASFAPSRYLSTSGLGLWG